MTSRSNLHSYINNSIAIRQEIQRFESVHPSIYAIYDLIELIPDSIVAQQIRDHVVCIEDSFVNSQEWTLSRTVPDIRVGIVGSLSSGKSALVHRYLTGSYMQEESPEGGRFKKELMIDGQSHLLLIRDEGGMPEFQFASWVDAVIFVFSLENEASFNAIYSYYTKLAHYRNYSDVPIALVGTQDAVAENSPRVIDDARIRKLSADLKRCPYYETCATYGLNVDRVFQDVCQKIVQQRASTSLVNSSYLTVTSDSSRSVTPCTPVPSPLIISNQQQQQQYSNSGMNRYSGSSSPSIIISSPSFGAPNSPSHYIRSSSKDGLSVSKNSLSSSNSNLHRHQEFSLPMFDSVINGSGKHSDYVPRDLPTPTSTPTASRKIRRRSNLFMSSKKGEDKLKNGELGSGRAIPLKQGYLYKKSGKTLNKEWKKKYVTLCDDGRLTYHPSLHDYMEDVHGKEISLQCVTVKIPGQKPRGSKTVTANSAVNDFINLSISGCAMKDKKHSDKTALAAFEVFRDPKMALVSAEDAMLMSNAPLSGVAYTNGVLDGGKVETPSVKKRHRRLKSTSVKNHDYEDGDGFEFRIVSLDNKQWQFEATSCEDRNEWIAAIEQQILTSLQNIESNKEKSRLHSSIEAASILSIRNCVQGNSVCVDCGVPNPDWASMNLGVLMCIECSGIHRNLGSHISKVRSLDLDDWLPEHLSVMLSIGNTLANSVWEGAVSVDKLKPSATSKREDKSQWIRSKYESKDFLVPLPTDSSVSQQLVDAIYNNDMYMVILSLAHATPDDVNSILNDKEQTPLHAACVVGCLPIVQLLLWHSADVKMVDSEGRSCLHYVNSILKTQRDSSGGLSVIKNLLINSGCVDTSITNNSIQNGSATSRRKAGLPPLDRLPSSII